MSGCPSSACLAEEFYSFITKDANTFFPKAMHSASSTPESYLHSNMSACTVQVMANAHFKYPAAVQCAVLSSVPPSLQKVLQSQLLRVLQELFQNLRRGLDNELDAIVTALAKKSGEVNIPFCLLCPALPLPCQLPCLYPALPCLALPHPALPLCCSIPSLLSLSLN